MRSLQTLPRLCVVTCAAIMLKLSLHMSSPDLINIPAKQHPVINRLHDAMTQAVAYAAAIEDNAIDDGQPIPAELVASFQADYDKIISHLIRAAT
jgi:hypothetical protein